VPELRDEQEVGRPIADDLVADVDVTAPCVSRLRQHRDSFSCQSEAIAKGMTAVY
jgi:hypothetical protein